jgi:putative PIN family toxin of toxin-antitoxin system
LKWVIDTNVLVSALLKKDTAPDRVVMKAMEGAFQCVVSDAILSEYQEVLLRPKLKIPPEKAKVFLDFLKGGILVSGKPSSQRLPDPKDQPFLDAALESGASVIVSGNLRDFPAEACRPVKAISPREALDQLLKPMPEPQSKKPGKQK